MTDGTAPFFRLETLAIGDELLTGRIADTNSAYVAGQLFQRGLRLERVTVVPDEDVAIAGAIDEIATRCETAVCFGGLGPTSDDRTAAVVAKILGKGLTEHEPSKAKLLRFMAERKRHVTAEVLKQIVFPEGATPLDNEVGLAVGFSFERKRCRFYFLPGVPHEMRAMVQVHILPDVERRAGIAGRLVTHTWKCVGIPESDLQIRMNPIEAQLPANAWLGYRTRFPENHLTLYWRRTGHDDEAPFSALRGKIGELLASYAYTETDREPEELVLERLRAGGKQLVLAESCTGGLTASRLTRLAGASDSFWGSFVTYRREAKAAMLQVTLPSDEATVSASASRQLAERALATSSAPISAAITGYLGPTGGTAADPLGTLYLCVGDGRRWEERRLVQPFRDRESAAWGAATQLLVAIARFLEKGG